MNQENARELKIYQAKKRMQAMGFTCKEIEFIFAYLYKKLDDRIDWLLTSRPEEIVKWIEAGS